MPFSISFTQIRDIENVRCGLNDKAERNLSGRIIWKLSDFDLCSKTDARNTFAVNSGILRLIPSIFRYFLE